MSAYNQAVAEEFRRILKDRRLTVSQAARDLRISRQAFHSYLNGKSAPRSKTIGRAMDLWDFRVKIGELELPRSAFATPSRESSKAEQLSFWAMWETLRKDDMKIDVKRVGSSLKFEVSIEIPA